MSGRGQQFSPMSRRRFLQSSAITVGGIALFGTAACGDDDSGSSSGSFEGQFSVPLYDQLPDNAPLIIAQEQGFFADRDLDLTHASFTEGPDVIRSIIQRTHLGHSSTISGLVGFESGFSELRIVGTVLKYPAIEFIVAPDSSVENVEDLAGLKVGVNAPTSITNYVATELVRSAGLSSDEVELINLGGTADAATALENGVVDVAWSSPPLSVQLEQEDKARVVFDAAEILPDLIQTTYFSDAEFIESDPDVVESWLSAIVEANDLIRTDVEEAGRTWAGAIGIDEAIAVGTLEKLQDAFDIAVTPAGYEANVTAITELGLAEEAIPYEDIVDDQFTQELA